MPAPPPVRLERSMRLPTQASPAPALRRYGWGRNAPKLDLPEGVGFSVGGASAIRYIVAQVR